MSGDEKYASFHLTNLPWFKDYGIFTEMMPLHWSGYASFFEKGDESLKARMPAFSRTKTYASIFFSNRYARSFFVSVVY